MIRPPRDLILATKNRDKVVEIRAGLSHLNGKLRLLTLDDFPSAPDVIEDGETLKQNAIKKAWEIHQATGLPALADDTGLMVDALDGMPGVYSNRYAGQNATYAENLQKLLRKMEGCDSLKRGARFCCVIAFAHKNKIECVRGECDGTIAFTPRGEGKFGYDPVFIVNGSGKTYAEMSMVEKNQISHRGCALRAAGELLARWLEQEAGKR